MALEEGRYVKGDMTDKRFEADGLAAYCRRFLSSGVWELGNNLKVSPGGGMKIIIGYGYALINGYLFGVVDNGTGPLQLTAEPATAQPRIDRVVGIADTTTQRVYAYIKKGTAAATPLAPALTADEISLARINIAAGASVIMSGDIIDERINDTVCGLVNVVDPFLVSLKQNLRFWVSPVSTSPATFLPGIWMRVTDTFIYAATDSGTYRVGQTGGHKDIQQHTHIQNAHQHYIGPHAHSTYTNIQHVDGTIVYAESLLSGLTVGGRRRYVDSTEYGGAGLTAVTTATSQNYGTGNSGNMPPWKSFYMWERTDI